MAVWKSNHPGPGAPVDRRGTIVAVPMPLLIPGDLNFCF